MTPKSEIIFFDYDILILMFILTSLLSLILILLSVLCVLLKINSKRYEISRWNSDTESRLDDLPTVSLCIPARNETHALEDCLGSATASDYPKLEIIVLDDCSQDRTSQIIRGFAHDGVRFVKGTVPSDDWLGKNNAYDILAKEARGDYLVFMSVDTRLEPSTVSMLIEYIQTNKLSMVSVLPRRPDAWRGSLLFAPLRYFWQVVLPLGLNTPTATSLWAVQSDSLAEIGGFSVYKDKIMIENMLAKVFFAKNEYHFLLASDIFRVWYAKKWSSQAETAIRLWYPSLQKNWLFCLFAIAAHLLFIIPFVTFVAAVIQFSLVLVTLSLAAVFLEYAMYYFYLRRVQTGIQIFFSMVLFPVVVMQEIGLIIISFYRYQRGDVSWKGRNVCYPVLKRTP